MEIERKFLIKELPENLDQYTCIHMEQAYLCTEPVVRVRKENDDYVMTYKGSGLLQREEANLPLTKESFEHLSKKADGLVIKKDRYVIPLDDPDFSLRAFVAQGITPKAAALMTKDLGLKIELDIFKTPSGLIMAEVEFPNVETARAFVKPSWFGEDVTNNKAYHNSNMSKGGEVFSAE